MLDKIKAIIDKEIRPFLLEDGGDIKLEKFEEGVLFISMQGVCSCCPRANETIKFSIERVLKEHCPEIKEVVRI